MNRTIISTVQFEQFYKLFGVNKTRQRFPLSFIKNSIKIVLPIIYSCKFAPLIYKAKALRLSRSGNSRYIST